MKKILILLFFPLICYPQNPRWTDYFSYFNVKVITKINNSIFSATENGIFSYNEDTGEIKKISKVNGLHELKITAFSYNQENEAIIIGYENGKLDVIQGDEIHLIVDIPFEQNYQGSKNVNHIFTQGDYAVISLDFGITIFDLKRLEFRETCYFRQGAEYFKVNKSVIHNNRIYAASNKGIYSHSLDGLIPNFSAWLLYGGGRNYTQIARNNDRLLSFSGNTVIESTDGINWRNVGNYANLRDIVCYEDIILFVQPNRITISNAGLGILNIVNYTDNLNTGFYSNGRLYGGTELKGLIRGTEYFAPDGPYKNISDKLTLIDNQMWVAPGGRDITYNAPVQRLYGYYHFDGNKWNHISYQDMNNERFVSKVIPNPSNLNEVFIASYGNGLRKMLNGRFSVLYNRSNSPIIMYERLAGGGFDTNGNLIIVQTFASESGNGVNNAIIVKTPADQFKYLSLLPKRISLTGGVMDPYIDSNGYIWVPSPRGNGLVVYKYNNTPLNTSDDEIYLIESRENSGNLPSDNVYCAILDNNGTAWIGTDSGLRIFRNPYPSLESGSYNTERIVITQNGLGEELLRGTAINAIAVDAANRKWIGTNSAGVFYLSENGTDQLMRFDVDNSPLPSNRITDIKIDKSGRIYFVTPQGIVSYKGDVVETGDKFGDVVAYPNPVRPGFTGNITIKGLAQDAYIKITDVAGNLVFETRAVGGIASWNGNNFNNKPVASGVYLVLMSNSDGSEHATTKIAIIR